MNLNNPGVSKIPSSSYIYTGGGFMWPGQCTFAIMFTQECTKYVWWGV